LGESEDRRIFLCNRIRQNSVCAGSVLLLLYATRPRLGLLAAGATAAVQLVLLLFLYLA